MPSQMIVLAIPFAVPARLPRIECASASNKLVKSGRYWNAILSIISTEVNDSKIEGGFPPVQLRPLLYSPVRFPKRVNPFYTPASGYWSTAIPQSTIGQN